jgi:hypothetical protein
MSALSDAVAGLAGTLKSVAGESVVYTRGPTSSDPITAVSDVQTYEVLDQQGVPISVLSYDFLFTTIDIVIDSAQIEPRSGDRIAATLNGIPCAFEVLPLGTKPCAEWVEPDGIMLVVHTKKLA